MRGVECVKQERRAVTAPDFEPGSQRPYPRRVRSSLSGHSSPEPSPMWPQVWHVESSSGLAQMARPPADLPSAWRLRIYGKAAPMIPAKASTQRGHRSPDECVESAG